MVMITFMAESPFALVFSNNSISILILSIVYLTNLRNCFASNLQQNPIGHKLSALGPTNRSGSGPELKGKLAGALVRVPVVPTGCKVANLSFAIEQHPSEVRLAFVGDLCLGVGVRCCGNRCNRTESHTQAICGR